MNFVEIRGVSSLLERLGQLSLFRPIAGRYGADLVGRNGSKFRITRGEPREQEWGRRSYVRQKYQGQEYDERTFLQTL